MSHRASDAVQITYESSCLSNDPPKRTNRCDKVKKGSLIEFNVTLTVMYTYVHNFELRNSFFNHFIRQQSAEMAVISEKKFN